MNPDLFEPCVIIPVYNHDTTIGAVVGKLREQVLHCILVDDGSHAACAAILDALVASDVTVVRRTANGGKGAAVQDGLLVAAASGYTHALQVDADGQHDLNDVPRLLEAARVAPNSLIGGRPIYGDDAPRARRYGRWLTTIWVWINTLSVDIPDAMCGFRVYPLTTTLPVLPATGKRMEFDIDVLVRLHWAGVPMRWIPTHVNYPADGVSHFRWFADNARISRVHARPFFGMLRRLSCLLRRRLRPVA